MSRHVQVGDEVVALSARRGASPERFTVRLGEGDSESVIVHRTPDGSLMITESSGRSYCAAISLEGTTAWVSVGGVTHRLAEAQLGGRGGGHADHGLEAPMPGKVLRVLVAPGDAVERGQTLLIVEAMKMEHAIKSPRDGRVEDVRFAEGDLVSPGEALITLAPDDGEDAA
ncbi:MAG: hypothetical protein H6745_12320 [Deltaproteobacteria bacterium]|nr:hypothetical protein [Deltaproteobacteria bacterium]